MVGMFALDNETRMVVYNPIDSNNEDLGNGAVIASHSDRFPAVSTRLEGPPDAVGSGKLYIVSDLGDEPSEEILNPAIVRYRFIRPSGE